MGDLLHLLEKFGVEDIRALDTEFRPIKGDHVWPLCAGGKSLVTGETFFEWYRPGAPRPGFLDFEDDRILWVTYSAAAEWGYAMAAGYCDLAGLPSNIVDLFAEDCMRVNGRLNTRDKRAKAKLEYALVRAGIADPYEGKKSEMQKMISECPDFSLLTPPQRDDIAVYQMQDVDMHAALFLHWADTMNAAQVLNRGDFTRVVANYEWHGIPCDAQTVSRIMANRTKMRNDIIAAAEEEHKWGIWWLDPKDGEWHWNQERFEGHVIERGLQDVWPKTKNGHYCIANPKRGGDEDKVFKKMCQRDPFFAPIREARALSDEMKSFSLPVGTDGRIRAGNIPFKQKTMRSSPMGGSIFAMDSRFRMLIEMPEGWTGIYSDLSSCEFVVAAMKSGDKNMIAMCNNVRVGLSQSPYIEIMKAAGLLGAESKSKSDAGPDYKNWKNGSLATIYGQEAEGLCNNLNVPMHIAHRIHGFVHSQFPQFWKYVEYERITSEARGYAETRGGWRLDVRHQKFRTLKNFPVQAEAAEIMHLGASKMSDGGVMICTTVHDAVLAMCPTERAQETAAFIAQCWREAGQEVIGYPISTDQYIFTGRFTESGSMPNWERLMSALDKAESESKAMAAAR